MLAAMSRRRAYKATKAPTAPTINAALAHCSRWLAAAPSKGTGMLVLTVVFEVLFAQAVVFVQTVVVVICVRGKGMSVGDGMSVDDA